MKVGTVLLLDDEDIVLKVQSASVRQFGFHAIMASTAEEALELVEARKPELIISDVQMPGDGGFDFVGQLRQRGLKTMPVIYLTAYDDVRLVSGGLKAGGDDFIIKGGGIDELRKRIAFWMISGFCGLPVDIKRRALESLAAAQSNAFLGVQSTLELNIDRINHISHQVTQEIDQCGTAYNGRLIDRLLVMGRVSKLLIDHSTVPGDFVRFPDYLRLCISRIGKEWTNDFSVLYANFDRWCQDIRFVRAGPVPLKPAADYLYSG